MSQGTINMPQLQPAQIGAIAQALGVAEDVFGIGAGGAKKRLLESQTRTANAEAESKELSNQMYREALAPDSAPPQAPSAQPVDATKYPLVAGAQQKSSAAPPAQDNASPLAASISGNGKFNPVKAGWQKIALELANAGAEYKLKQAQVANIPLDQQKKQLELGEINQRMGLAAQEATRKGQDQSFGVSKAFNDYEPTKQAKATISASQTLARALKSGNPIDIQLAKAQLPLVAMEIKRMGGDSSLTDPKQLLERLNEVYTTKKTGVPPSEALNNLIQVTNRLQVGAQQSLNDLADTWSQQAEGAGISGMNAAQIKDKLLMPGGAHTREQGLPPKTVYGDYLKRKGVKSGK